MHVIEVKQFGGPETLEMVEEPTPAPKDGQIVVEVKASGINFADIMAREGHYSSCSERLPFRPGFEVAGNRFAARRGCSGPSNRRAGFGHGGGAAAMRTMPWWTPLSAVCVCPTALDFAPATALLVQGLTAFFLLENRKPAGRAGPC